MPRNNIYLDLIGKLEKKISGMAENSLLASEQKMAEEFDVSKPTLRRALKAMADSGLIRKINGVGVLVSKPPQAISRELIFLCHDIVFFAETLQSFGATATESNYFISIVPLIGDERAQGRIIASVAERHPAGVAIYADSKHNQLPAFHQLAASGIPTVYVMRLPHGIDNNLLEFGNADGVTEIVENFYREGCRRIALYGDERVNPAAAAEREQGFLTGMKKCRLKPRPELWCSHDADDEQREKFLQLFAGKNTRPDAVCSLNDHCAGSLIKTLIKRKINVDSIHFSGFDHSLLSEFIPQPLLTVKPPMAELGKAAAEMLIRQVENPQFGFQRRKLQSAVFTTEK